MLSTTPRACDRCHALKERCTYPSGATKCARCSRLDFSCLRERPQKKAGRPKQRQRKADRHHTIPTSASGTNIPLIGRENPCDQSRSTHMRLSLPIPQVLDQFNDLTKSEKAQLQKLFLNNDAAFERFLLGPSFRETRRNFAISHFFSLKNTTKEAYLAFAFSGINASDLVDEIESDDNSCYAYAASALMKLRELEVNDANGVSECLSMGGMLTTFALCSSALDVVAINRHALCLVKPFYEADRMSEPQEVIILTYWILIELMDCMMRGFIPSVKFRPLPHLTRQALDPVIGVCGSILPYSHEVCRLGHELSEHNQDWDGMLEVLAEINTIESQVSAWEPEVTEQLCLDLRPSEVAHMLCQVETMRSGTLIHIHRLRYPYGVNDEAAQIRALGILQQLHLARSSASKCVPGVFHALLLAYFELVTENDRQRWLPRLPLLVEFSSQFATSMQDLVASFWHSRDTGNSVFAYNVKDATLGLSHNDWAIDMETWNDDLGTVFEIC